ncbi:hypothetical protein DFH09DRAFT_1283286 [Mycena vulgaris]|nr:hypothetical protein DFH09DRAFT_1283286 [Mycena vulgaris]
MSAKREGEVPTMLQEELARINWVGFGLGGLRGLETMELRSNLTRERSAVALIHPSSGISGRQSSARQHLFQAVFRAAPSPSPRSRSMKFTHPCFLTDAHFINVHDIDIKEGYTTCGVLAFGAEASARTAALQRSASASGEAVAPFCIPPEFPAHSAVPSASSPIATAARIPQQRFAHVDLYMSFSLVMHHRRWLYSLAAGHLAAEYNLFRGRVGMPVRARDGDKSVEWYPAGHERWPASSGSFSLAQCISSSEAPERTVLGLEVISPQSTWSGSRRSRARTQRQQTCAWGCVRQREWHTYPGGHFRERARFADPPAQRRRAVWRADGARTDGLTWCAGRWRWHASCWVTDGARWMQNNPRESSALIPRTISVSTTPDLAERYLRTVNRLSEFSATWVEISRLSWTRDGRGALEVRGTAMKLPGDAGDEIPEDNTWSWWLAAARRRPSLRNTTGTVS